ncbi:MAG TPA: hypothetical protein VH110_05270 [Candidatus Acidoferrum sp.]|jgi:hypothetical protein|nr:hypothetical protein [Candidatus Acidoferrum sp.]
MATKKPTPEKNPAAQALVALRWAKTTPEERRAFAARMAEAGWKGANRARRLKTAGRPRTADRCPCGAMTRKRARARGHRCEEAAA